MKDYINEINRLLNSAGARRRKYLRNARLYTFSPTITLDDPQLNTVVGYSDITQQDIDNDTLPGITENVIAACIDTLTSQIAANKVRPYFNTVGSDWRDRQITKSSQRFFDIYCDVQDINRTVVETFKDSCIFDTGYIYCNPETYNVERIHPWRVFYDWSEYMLQSPTKVVLEFRQFPTTLIPNYKGKENYVTKVEYFDKLNKKWITMVNGKEYKSREWNHDCLPIISIPYSDSVSAGGCCSITDQLYGIQMTINDILRTVRACLRRNPALTFFVPEGSDLKVKELNNRVGNAFYYRPNNIAGKAVEVSTPAPIDGMYRQMLNDFKEDAFNMVGVSQLSSEGQKPAGLNSGIALATYDDLKMARFQTQINRVIRLYTAIAVTMMEIFPPEANILPDFDYKWSDIIKAKDKFKIQFNSAQSLSKDPSTKLQFINELVNQGYIPRSMAASLLELPDIENAMSYSQNSYNAVYSVITDCIDNDNYEVPFYVPNDLLEEEICNVILCTKGASKKDADKVIKKLVKLYNNVLNRKKEIELQKQELAIQKQEQELDKQMNDAINQAMIAEESVATGQVIPNNVEEPVVEQPVEEETEETVDTETTTEEQPV